MPDRDATPEMLLDLMKANGVSKTVIIQVIHYRYDNRYLADVLKRYPGTFQGVCRVDPLDPAAPDHLSQLTEQGFRGVRLSPAGNASGDWFRGPLMPPLWKRCCRTEGADDRAGAHHANAGRARRCSRSMPDLTVVIDHMADCPIDQPAELEKLIALKRYPNCFREDFAHLVDLEAAVSLAGRAGVRQAASPRVRPAAADVGHRLADRRRLLHLRTRGLSVVRDDMKFLNADDKQWMLSKTIERVWPFQ